MTRLTLPILRPVDGGGNPYPSGTLTFFDAGASTTPKTVYSDSALSVSLGSGVTADGEGLFTDIYYSGDIRAVLKDKTGVIQRTMDIYGAGNIDTGDIADGAVTETKIDAAAVSLSKLLVLDNARIITSNGVANAQVSLSGDVTMTNTGVVTVGNLAISAAKLAADAVETAKIKDVNVTEGKLSAAVQAKLNRIYRGFVENSTGIASWTGTYPSGWSLSNQSTPYRVRVTHNLASTDYSVVVTAERTGASVCYEQNIYAHDQNYFDVILQQNGSIVETVQDFHFILITG